MRQRNVVAVTALSRYDGWRMDGLSPTIGTAGALNQFIGQFKQVNEALIDAWFVVDNDRNIVDFNRAFFGMLPRNLARGLKGKKCYEVIELNICKDACIAHQCWRDKRQVRLDEITGHVSASANVPGERAGGG